MKILLSALILIASIGLAPTALAAQGDPINACNVLNFSGPGAENSSGKGQGVNNANLAARCNLNEPPMCPATHPFPLEDLCCIDEQHTVCQPL